MNRDSDVIKTKVVLVGGVAVGKTSIIYRFVKEDFEERLESTIGASFMIKKINIDEKTIHFSIWDTAGQEQYHSLVPLYFRKASCVLVVYSIDSRESFQDAKVWVSELKDQAPTDVFIALLGNKKDLEEHRVVETKEGAKFASEIDAIFMETSAKGNIGIREVFNKIGHRVLKKYFDELEKKNSRQNDQDSMLVDSESVDPFHFTGNSGCRCHKS